MAFAPFEEDMLLSADFLQKHNADVNLTNRIWDIQSVQFMTRYVVEKKVEVSRVIVRKQSVVLAC